MIKAREIPWSPEWIAQYQSDLEALDPLDFWILVEELELKLKLKSETLKKKVKTHDYQSNPECIFRDERKQHGRNEKANAAHGRGSRQRRGY